MTKNTEKLKDTRRGFDKITDIVAPTASVFGYFGVGYFAPAFVYNMFDWEITEESLAFLSVGSAIGLAVIGLILVFASKKK